MNTLTASNGGTVVSHRDGITVECPAGFGRSYDLPQDEAEALRQFFRAEEDERLKRWRWQEDPSVVVYRWSKDYLNVVHETNGASSEHRREDVDACRHLVAVTDLERAARAYFDAHRETKPWHDAKVGEVWVIRLRGEDEETACLVESFEDTHVFQMPDAESITTTRDIVETARRIWPEIAS